MQKFLYNFFKLKDRKTNIKTEILGGTTTFLTMAYVIFVQPAILSIAGMDFGAVMTSTCIAAAVAMILMGLFANYPIAMAPLMGENFFFVFTVVIGMHFSWQVALAAVLIEGILFMLLSSTKIREMIVDGLPESLKMGMAMGIALFIAFIGLRWSGIVVSDQATGVTLGNLESKPVLVAVCGIVITAALMARKVKGAILWGILSTTVIALFAGVAKFYGIVSAPPSIAPVFMKFDFSKIFTAEFILIVFVMLYMEVFDTIGTIVGIGTHGGFIKNKKMPGVGRALFVDSVGTTLGAVFGNSTVSSYIESNTGVSEGARTGLANLVTAAFFILALFFYPLVKTIGSGVEIGPGNFIYPCVAPALIIVGFLMISHMVKIDFADITESLPAYLTIIGIPLTYNIYYGIAFGVVSYPLIKIIAGRSKDVTPLMYVLSSLFVVSFIIKYAIVK